MKEQNLPMRFEANIGTGQISRWTHKAQKTNWVQTSDFMVVTISVDFQVHYCILSGYR
jgi:hypothetical protein